MVRPAWNDSAAFLPPTSDRTPPIGEAGGDARMLTTPGAARIVRHVVDPLRHGGNPIVAD
ncbi:hypothetical protein [Micromonospora sp. NPDC049645]|uniref:hypothetical protein n=1 Tax=Micromonospora sp. NPDC049645 TaxID=3155508 RepID=UPI00341F5466